jgi:hypothetical protein
LFSGIGEPAIAWVLEASAPSYLEALAANTAGRVVILGEADQPVTLGSHTVAAQPGGDPFAAWVSIDGTVDTVRRLVDASGTHTSSGLAVSGDRAFATFAVAGTTVVDPDGQAHVLELSTAATSLVVLAFGAEGVEWTTTITGPNVAAFPRIAPGPDGGVLISSESAGGEIAVAGPDGSAVIELDPMGVAPGHAFVVSLDSLGNPRWTLGMSGDAASSVSSFVSLDDGAVAIGGRFGAFVPSVLRVGLDANAPTLMSISGDDDPAADAFVAVVGGDGVARWAKRITSYGWHGSLPMAKLPDGFRVAVTSAGYDIVYDDGEPTEVRISEYFTLGEFAPDGELRSAVATSPYDLTTVNRATARLATSPWAALGVEPLEVPFSADRQHVVVLSVADGGQVSGARHLEIDPNGHGELVFTTSVAGCDLRWYLGGHPRGMPRIGTSPPTLGTRTEPRLVIAALRLE